jgi:hypothetical protein
MFTVYGMSDSGNCYRCGTFLPESNAMLHYLAEGTCLLPSGASSARVLQWMFFEQFTVAA